MISSSRMKALFFAVLFAMMLKINGRSISFEKEDTLFWLEKGAEELHEALEKKPMGGIAKNVILFIGDGMGLSTVTATRIYKGQRVGLSGEDYRLIYEKFPSVGLVKTYNVNKQVPDSAGTATAIFTGVKSKFYMLGYDVKAPYNKCDADINRKSTLTSIMQWAQDAGKSTGFVTTTRITHATPAALYAHVNHRDWECDGEIPEKYRNCTKDIARQLVEDLPGREFKVIMGGGWNPMGHTSAIDEDESCIREDGRDLVYEWKLNKKNMNANYKYISDSKGLRDLNTDVEYVLGIFSTGHLPYEAIRDTSLSGQPSLVDMTTKAIKILQKEKKGFVLMVEGGRIDHAHHENYAKLALEEAAHLDDAIGEALSLINPEETLIIVTADHSHAFTINGYPKRGNDILGFANDSKVNFAYETLTYANGPSYYYHRINDSKGPNDTWRNVAEDENRGNLYYQHFAPIYLEDETHAGEDVPIYAKGPQAHLLQGVHEQNFIAHVVSNAACIGPHRSFCKNVPSRGMKIKPWATIIFILFIAFIFM